MDCLADKELLDVHIQRVDIKTLVPGWRSMMNDVPQGFVLKLVLNISINDPESRIKCYG